MTHHIAQIRQALLHLPHCPKESQRRIWLEGIRKATDAIQEDCQRMERNTARMGERLREMEAEIAVLRDRIAGMSAVNGKGGA